MYGPFLENMGKTRCAFSGNTNCWKTAVFPTYIDLPELYQSKNPKIIFNRLKKNWNIPWNHLGIPDGFFRHLFDCCPIVGFYPCWTPLQLPVPYSLWCQQNYWPTPFWGTCYMPPLKTVWYALVLANKSSSNCIRRKKWWTRFFVFWSW